ncbi:MAG: DUF5131 family protein [Candidatus Poribacteria bacterium]
MMENTNITWTDSTVNFWTGCIKYSEGCQFCYMYRDQHRYGKDPTQIVRTKDATFYQAYSWKEPRQIFTCSWSDFFIPEADPWRDDAWEVIRNTAHHQWQILTKRSERIQECLPDDWGTGYENVWLGASIENEKRLYRKEELTSVPAKIHFLSLEPLLAPIPNLDLADIEWIIIGGESGNDKGKYRYRPCELQWIADIVSQCRRQGVPVFVKQLGTYLAKQLGLRDRKGGNINEFPERMRIQEFPVTPSNSHELTTEVQRIVRQRTDEIKTRVKRTTRDLIEIGNKLVEVKHLLRHGTFSDWLKAEFDWTERTAQRLISVAEAFKSDKLSDLSLAPSALYLLAAPSTPKSARREALERAEHGETITHAKAKAIRAAHAAPKGAARLGYPSLPQSVPTAGTPSESITVPAVVDEGGHPRETESPADWTDPERVDKLWSGAEVAVHRAKQTLQRFGPVPPVSPPSQMYLPLDEITADREGHPPHQNLAEQLRGEIATIDKACRNLLNRCQLIVAQLDRLQRRAAHK